MTPSGFAYAPWLLAAAAAMGLFAWGHLRARRNKPAPERISGKEARSMLSVMEAAARVYEAAKREGMTIVWVAENAHDAAGPVAWFAGSIVGVVPAYRKMGGDFERIRSADTTLQSLYIRERDCRTYIDWARAMQ
ncbi:MAG TPA: hypothetical protein VG889_11585 [Rhizomicrobium sp.]|nr:hypothetical protein [Rhizomicrobium sp.]